MCSAQTTSDSYTQNGANFDNFEGTNIIIPILDILQSLENILNAYMNMYACL